MGHVWKLPLPANWGRRNLNPPLSDRCPTKAELLFLAVFIWIVFLITIHAFGDFWQRVDTFGDNIPYIATASAIERWDFHGLRVKHGWGLPYAIAGISKLSGISNRTALLLVSFIGYVSSIWLAYRLWGGWITSYFAVLNLDWMQRSFMGGAEPMFMALLFSAFLMIRKNKWQWAALLAALSTMVRPLGFLALVGMSVNLLWKHEFRKFALVLLIGVVVGALYTIPFILYFGDPLVQIAGYRSDWAGGNMLDLPLRAIIRGTLSTTPWTNLILTYGWILFVMVGIVAGVAAKRNRDYARAYANEALFAVLYVALIFTYNSPQWARSNFPRFAIPILPFVLVALKPWVPKSRTVIWGLAVASPILAAISVLGVRNVIQMIGRG